MPLPGRLFALAMVASLCGCATLPQPQLANDIRSQYRIAEIIVTVPENAKIWWGDAEREYAASKHIPTTTVATDLSSAASNVSDNKAEPDPSDSPEVRAYVREKLKEIVKTAVTAKTSRALTGAKPARLKVDVRELFIASGAQRILVGGNHSLLSDVTLEDSATGAVLFPRELHTAIVPGGNGISGVIADQIVNQMMNDPVYRLADQLGSSIEKWFSPQASG